ncbi:MAG: PhoU domain-containing protein [Candidatus Undinarchaeales archaeon]
MGEIKKKAKEYYDMYRIWRKRPGSTFKEISDIYRKRPILNKAYKSALEMLKKDQEMFEHVCDALLSTISKEKVSKDEDIIKNLSKEDDEINEYASDVRRHILEYLAENSAPDVKSSLVLTSLIIDLERLGDYTKDLAKITLFDPVNLFDGGYLDIIREYKEHLVKMFENTVVAFGQHDKDTAENVMKMNKEFRERTDKILLEVNEDSRLRKRDAITYTLMTRYFRRVAGHLENIASSVISPFPYIGFKKRELEKQKGKREKGKK